MSSSEENDIFDEEGVDIEAGQAETSLPANKHGDSSPLSHLKITVSDPEKKSQMTGLKMQETFVVYLIETSPLNVNSSVIEEVTSLWRRYSEFEQVRNYLMAIYPAVVMPPLPEKRANFVWNKLTAVDTFDLDFLERRRAGLESFLHRISEHPKLGNDEIVKDFMLKEDGWKEKLVSSDYQSKSDSWLRRMNASLRVKQPDIRFEQLKSYANHLQTASSNLLRIRAKLAERVYGIYKIHGNYERVFKELALVENPPLRGILQKAAVEIETLGKSIDTLVDEEDLIAEQLKEYLYFAEALKVVCQKHEALQYDVEWYENQLVNLLSEKKQILSGNSRSFSFSGMKARLMGTEKGEQVENRVEQLDKNISESEKNLEQSKLLSKEFLDEALNEAASFKKRKVMDLREILINYSILQIKMNREGVAIWEKFKSHFDLLLQTK